MALRRYDAQLTTDESNSLLGEVALQLLDQLQDQSIALEFRTALKRADFKFLCDYTPDYCSLSVSDSRILRQVTAFFSKRVDLPLNVDPDAVAYSKFMESEQLCRESNDIFMKWRQGGFFFPRDVDLVFYKASRKIASILGDIPSLNDLYLHFGPGATTNVKKQESCPRVKLGQKIQCSENLLPILEEVLEEVPRWADVWSDEYGDRSVQVTDGVLSFVPKSYKTSRCIVVEPVLNGFVQLGIGEYISERLKMIGLDLSTQESRNRDLARLGSLTGELATLDLSSASDTISKGIVEHLLPPDWVTFLESVRTSSVYTPNGDLIRLEKFSSMGNGFTFPLETLIFYALSWASTDDGRDKVNCYGDDIIVPTASVALLKKVLLVGGFLLNSEKSFVEGPFRESCGGDYLKGFDIRPVYVKDRVSCADVFRLHNFFFRLGQQDVCTTLLQYVHPDVQIFGPDGFGDGHLLGDWTPYYKESFKTRGYCGATFDTYTFNERSLTKRFLPGDFVLPAYSVYTSSTYEVEPTLRHVFARLPRNQWGSLRFSKPSVTLKFNRNDEAIAMTTRIPGTKGYSRISIYVLNPWAL